MPDVVITEFMDEAVVADLATEFDVYYDPELASRPDATATQVAEARALIVRNRTSVDRSLLDAAPGLVAVGRLGVGLDNIDVAACEERGIEVLPATGANSGSVAEYVIGAVLTLMRPALSDSRRVLAGDWPRQSSIGSEIAGKNMGLIGLGDIARLVAAKANALGMTVSAYDPVLEPDDPAWQVATSVSFPELLGDSDAVSLHVPLVDATRRMIDASAIAQMKPSAVLVNTARGGVVDEGALVAALHAGQLGGAALDVFEREPLDATGAQPFSGAPNLILTPHIAGLTTESQHRVSVVTATNIRQALTGVGP